MCSYSFACTKVCIKVSSSFEGFAMSDKWVEISMCMLITHLPKRTTLQYIKSRILDCFDFVNVDNPLRELWIDSTILNGCVQAYPKYLK